MEHVVWDGFGVVCVEGAQLCDDKKSSGSCTGDLDLGRSGAVSTDLDACVELVTEALRAAPTHTHPSGVARAVGCDAAGRGAACAPAALHRPVGARCGVGGA